MDIPCREGLVLPPPLNRRDHFDCCHRAMAYCHNKLSASREITGKTRQPSQDAYKTTPTDRRGALNRLRNALIDGRRCFAGGPQPIDAIEAQMMWFCSYTLDIIGNHPASQAVCRGFDSLRPIQNLGDSSTTSSARERNTPGCRTGRVASELRPSTTADIFDVARR